MRYWRNLLGGLILWAVHFVAVYGIASVLPGTGAAVILVGLATGVALGAAGWQLARTAAALRGQGEEVGRWSGRLALLGYAVAGVAIAFQGLPALLS
jgi:hypothetical protein